MVRVFMDGFSSQDTDQFFVTASNGFFTGDLRDLKNGFQKGTDCVVVSKVLFSGIQALGLSVILDIDFCLFPSVNSRDI